MSEKKTKLKLRSNITQRDFIGGTLAAVGGGMLILNVPFLQSCATPEGPYKRIGVFNDPWKGFGGVGDYAISNGNVASTRDAAHLVRDGFTKGLMGKTEDTGEEYDMVIIGGGFSGIGAAYEFHEKFGDTKKCLIIENNPVFGGEAKQNEFDVDGYHLYAAQESNDFGHLARMRKG